MELDLLLTEKENFILSYKLKEGAINPYALSEYPGIQRKFLQIDKTLRSFKDVKDLCVLKLLTVVPNLDPSFIQRVIQTCIDQEKDFETKSNDSDDDVKYTVGEDLMNEALQHQDIALLYLDMALLSPSLLVEQLLEKQLSKEQYADFVIQLLIRYKAKDDKIEELL